MQPQPDPVDSGTEAERIAKRLSVVALAVAVADDGSGPFDNFLPCVRRGVIDYRDTEAGRHATFSGCDVGGGVVIDGEGELRWIGPDLSPSRENITRMRFDGTLDVAIDDQAPQAVDAFEIDDIQIIRDDSAGFPERLSLISMVVTLDGDSLTVDQPALVTSLFDSSNMTIDAIPNPNGSVAELGDADVKRIAYHAGTLYLLRILLGEAQESQRGDHSHDLPCGTSDVSYDMATQNTRLDHVWTDCEHMGLFMTGDFSMQWANQPVGNRLEMVLDGSLTLGGGIPTVTIESMQLSMLLPESEPPWNIRLTGSIQGAADATTFDYTVVADD